MAQIFADTFDRVNQNKWGTPSDGSSDWVDFDTTYTHIVSNQGAVLANTGQANGSHTLTQDNDIVITLSLNTWTAVTDVLAIMIKANGGNRDGFGLEIGAGAVNNLVIRDSSTYPIATASFTFTATTTYLFEIDISSTYAMDIYIWASGGSKPGSPTISSAAASRTGAGTKFMLTSNTQAALFDSLVINNNTVTPTASSSSGMLLMGVGS